MTLTNQAPSMATTIAHQPTLAIPPARAVPAWALALAAVVSGCLLYAGFFPLNQGWCTWLALVPLLLLVRIQARGRVIYGSAMLGGLVFFVPALRWMTVAHPMMLWAWMALSAYLSLYVVLAVWLLRRIDRLKLPLALTLPVVWVSLEYMRAHFLTGFAWLFLGHTQHDYLPIIQVTDLGGVYAVSLLVAAVNGLIFDVLTVLRAIPVPRSRYVGMAAAAVMILMASNLAYGFWRLGQNDFADGPRVTMLQTNIPQAVKNERASGSPAASWIIQHTKDLTDEVLRSKVGPDLIIWPETTFTQDWYMIEDGTPADDLPIEAGKWIADRHLLVGSVAKYSQAHVLLGLNTIRFGRGMTEARFNSALLVRNDGAVAERYDKIHRVLFGEYLPFRHTLPFMQWFSPYPFDYSLTAGEQMTRFTLPTASGTYRFGVLVCYEDSDPLLARRYAQESPDGPPVDFLVNISNDGWFDGTEEHELHMAVCRFRAIEARRAVVRSVNMGISGVIDGNGRVTALPGASWAESKKVAAVPTAVVPIDRRTSIYSLAGDWLAAMCAVAAIGFTIAGMRRT